MRMSKAVLAACVALALTTACGGGGSDGAALTGVTADVQGTWVSDCQVTGASNSRVLRAVFSGNGFTMSIDGWANTACTGTALPVGSYAGTFKVGAAVTAALGATSVTAYQVDITAAIGTTYDLGYVDKASTPNRLYFGDISGANDGSTPALRPTALDTTDYLHR